MNPALPKQNRLVTVWPRIHVRVETTEQELQLTLRCCATMSFLHLLSCLRAMTTKATKGSLS